LLLNYSIQLIFESCSAGSPKTGQWKEWPKFFVNQWAG
jgi:hypothetical protein